MVAQRRARGSAEQKDILTALVASLDQADKAERLAEHEVFANVFLLLLSVGTFLHRLFIDQRGRRLTIRAGHETSANTLTFLISFLATMPEVQDKMLTEIEATDTGELLSLRLD
jgi:cytochrome P450